MLMYFCIARAKHRFFPLRLSVVVTPLETRSSHTLGKQGKFHPYVLYQESEGDEDFLLTLPFWKLFTS